MSSFISKLERIVAGYTSSLREAMKSVTIAAQRRTYPSASTRFGHLFKLVVARKDQMRGYVSAASFERQDAVPVLVTQPYHHQSPGAK